MLPEVISNALASLQPARVRLTKTAFLEFTADGLRTAADLANTAIKSRKRLSYEQVDQYIADPEPSRRKLGTEVFDLLGRMRELAAILRRRRFLRGALEISIAEVKVDLDKAGRVSGAARGRKHREPPDHRGVYARGQRGRGGSVCATADFSFFAEFTGRRLSGNSRPFPSLSRSWDCPRRFPRTIWRVASPCSSF